MANLKELRNRITSVTSTQKITRAMQMVAASKLRRAQEAVEATRPYSDKLSTVVGNLSKEMDGDDNAPELLVGNGNSERYLFVVATSERGLCGGFNSSITRLASKSARSLIKKGKDVKVMCVGKKGKAALSREFGESIIEFFDFSDVRNLSFAEGDSIAKKIGQKTFFLFNIKNLLSSYTTETSYSSKTVWGGVGGLIQFESMITVTISSKFKKNSVHNNELNSIFCHVHRI